MCFSWNTQRAGCIRERDNNPDQDLSFQVSHWPLMESWLMNGSGGWKAIWPEEKRVLSIWGQTQNVSDGKGRGREISISFRALKVSSIDKIMFHLIQNLHGFRYGWKVLSNYLNVARVTHNDTIFYFSRTICQIVSYVDGKVMSTIC